MERKDITINVAPEALIAMALMLERKLDEWEEDPDRELQMLVPTLVDEFRHAVDEMSKKGKIASGALEQNLHVRPVKVIFKFGDAQHELTPLQRTPVVKGWHLIYTEGELVIGLKGQRVALLRNEPGQIEPVEHVSLDEIHHRLVYGDGLPSYLERKTKGFNFDNNPHVTGCHIEWVPADKD